VEEHDVLPLWALAAHLQMSELMALLEVRIAKFVCSNSICHAQLRHPDINSLELASKSMRTALCLPQEPAAVRAALSAEGALAAALRLSAQHGPIGARLAQHSLHLDTAARKTSQHAGLFEVQLVLSRNNICRTAFARSDVQVFTFVRCPATAVGLGGS